MVTDRVRVVVLWAATLCLAIGACRSNSEQEAPPYEPQRLAPPRAAVFDAGVAAGAEQDELTQPECLRTCVRKRSGQGGASEAVRLDCRDICEGDCIARCQERAARRGDRRDDLLFACEEGCRITL
jgi:hypothetical protein